MSSTPPTGDAQRSEGDEPTSLEDVVSIRSVFDAISIPVYALDSENTVILWSEGLHPLLGLTRDEMLGTDDPFGQNAEGERIKTLANRVVDAPRDAEQFDGISRLDSEYTTGVVYEKPTWIVNYSDEKRFVRFLATPIFEDGEFRAVVQMCVDETGQRQKRAATEDLVEELIDVLDRLGGGDLDARASFDQRERINADHLRVLDQVNEMATNLERLVGSIETRTDELQSSAEQTTSAAADIDDIVNEQATSLTEVVEEVEDISARMEEIAATSDQVAAAAEQAREATTDGIEAGEQVERASEQLQQSGEGMATTMAELEASLVKIEEVVDVISDIADQTNILSLNAAIEASHAGAEGDGFGVVADEVKALAEETGENADTIATQIEEIHTQTDRTVEAVESARAEITTVASAAETTLDAFEEIEALVEEAARGIQEVATANDGQAEAIEEITGKLERSQEYATDAQTRCQSILERAEDQQQSIDDLHARVDELTTSND